jgi:hypothetical protein
MRRITTFVLLLAAALPVAGRAQTACPALAGLTVPGHALKIASAREVPAGPMALPPGAPPMPALQLPAHCRVDGALDERVGRNGRPYAIRFALALPVDWNGRFYFQGGGGLNGSVRPPVGAEYAGDTPALSRGFAVVSTDSGHEGEVFDATFMEDQEAALNFLHQAVAKVTVVAKEIIAAHYGRPAQHAYFVGCSTGGREAMMMSQRYPGYFDGIVAGAPAMRTGYSNLALRWASTQLNAIAPRDAQGVPQTQLALTEADRRLVIDGFLAACDALDGARDGMVFATRACNFDPQVLACTAAKADGCLDAAKVNAVKALMAGPRDSRGRQVYPGFPYDTGIANTQGLPGLLVGPVIPEGTPPGTTMDVDEAAANAHDARSMVGDTDAWTNLSSFHGRGGKLIFFHGVSDPWFSALETVRYYEKLGPDNAPARLTDWSRLFLVPGMGHCAGGDRTVDRFDMVGAIVDWVERGKAPDRVIARSSQPPVESRPLCPWPQYAHREGRGDATKAESYSCRE